MVEVTQFDHHSVSVAAIRTNPFPGIHDFVIGVYPYCPLLIVVFAIPVKLLLVSGSFNKLDIPAANNSAEIPLNDPAVEGNHHLSIWYATNAAATCDSPALRATSFALPLALESFGKIAAARIPIITITISISISVNAFFLFFLENIK